jgi:hypothetical protein
MLDIQSWRNIVIETGIYIHKFRRQTTNLLHLNAENSVSETEDQWCYKLTKNTQEMKLELRKEDLHLQNGSLLRNLRVLGLSLLRIWELGLSQSISNPKINA